MRTIGIAELERNPREVVEHVRDTGEDVEIVFYNQPTGVLLTPSAHHPAKTVRGVKGSVLLATPNNLDRAEADRWIADIHQQRESEDDTITDPWETR